MAKAEAGGGLGGCGLRGGCDTTLTTYRAACKASWVCFTSTGCKPRMGDHEKFSPDIGRSIPEHVTTDLCPDEACLSHGIHRQGLIGHGCAREELKHRSPAFSRLLERRSQLKFLYTRVKKQEERPGLKTSWPACVGPRNHTQWSRKRELKGQMEWTS